MAKSSSSGKTKPRKPGSTSGKKKKVATKAVSESIFNKWSPFILLAISILVVLQARIKLLAIPMERDEAGFAYIGHWLLRDKSLYIDVVDNKLPGLYMMYGLFTSLFGYNAVGVHLGLFLVSIASGIFFYLLLRELYNWFIATAGTAFLIVLLTSINVVGFAAHATQLLLPFILGGFLLFWKGIKSNRSYYFLLAGLLIGFAFIIKQQSIVFGILAAIIWWPVRMWWNQSERSSLPIAEWILLGAGGLLPVIFTATYFAITDRFDDLYFWSVEQPAKLAASFGKSPVELFQSTFPKVIKDFWGIWIASLLGIIGIWFSGLKKSASIFAVLFGLLGFASIVIGAGFYKHYFIIALPGVALLAAIFLNWISVKVEKQGVWLSSAIGLILLLWPVLAQKEYFFNPDYAKIHQISYSQNMFPELEKIGEELSKRVPAGQRIGIMGSEPGVLVAAGREGCSKHLFMYPLLSDPETSPALQTEYLGEMKECSPEYIVFNTSGGSWTIGYDQLHMFKQLLEWINQNYTTSGIAEMRPDAPGVIVWDAAVATQHSLTDYKVYVFKKNSK